MTNSTTTPNVAAKSAIIVGASSGIGAALARSLAKSGYTLALIARRQDHLDQLCSEINAATGNENDRPVARSYQHNVREYDQAPALFARILADFGAGAQLCLVVYNAGVLPKSTDGVWTFDEERDMLETNLLGAVRWLDLAAEVLATSERGAIVGVSSVAGDRGRNGNSVYQASKAGLSVYLESLRYRLRRRGVRVVTIKPGYVATSMIAGVKLPRPLVTSAETVAARIVRASEHAAGDVYVPRYWGALMWIMRHLPSAVMARLPV
ncbi:MAG: SDR family NAD(P)-dependent oxidoreductase [Ktedonobacterales bacterium]